MSRTPTTCPWDGIRFFPNQPAENIDVVFSNGGFTGEGGHPAEIVKRNIDRGVGTEAEGDGAFYYTVSDEVR